MRQRTFNNRQRRVLAWIAGGRCQKCGEPLTSEFHADHVMPFAKGGVTVISNGQALCATCNLRKGVKQ